MSAPGVPRHKELLKAARALGPQYAKRRLEGVPTKDLAAEAEIGFDAMARILRDNGVDFAKLRKDESVSVRRTGAKKSPNQRHPRRARSFEDMMEDARNDT